MGGGESEGVEEAEGLTRLRRGFLHGTSLLLPWRRVGELEAIQRLDALWNRAASYALEERTRLHFGLYLSDDRHGICDDEARKQKCVLFTRRLEFLHSFGLEL